MHQKYNKFPKKIQKCFHFKTCAVTLNATKHIFLIKIRKIS